MTELIIPSRFCGPASSGNGGWTSGALAGLVEPGSPDNRADRWPAIRVALRMPPPLDIPLAVAEEDGVTRATLDGAVVAQAQVADADPAPVEPVPTDEARAAMATYPGLTSHPFPTCFACGTGREEGDGLRIFPGPVGIRPVSPTTAPPGSPPPGRRTRASPRTGTRTSTTSATPRSPSPGPRSTAWAAGPATSPSG